MYTISASQSLLCQMMETSIYTACKRTSFRSGRELSEGSPTPPWVRSPPQPHHKYYLTLVHPPQAHRQPGMSHSHTVGSCRRFLQTWGPSPSTASHPGVGSGAAAVAPGTGHGKRRRVVASWSTRGHYEWTGRERGCPAWASYDRAPSPKDQPGEIASALLLTWLLS